MDQISSIEQYKEQWNKYFQFQNSNDKPKEIQLIMKVIPSLETFKMSKNLSIEFKNKIYEKNVSNGISDNYNIDSFPMITLRVILPFDYPLRSLPKV